MGNATIRKKSAKGEKFITIIRECPRFAPLVQELRLEQCPHGSESEDAEYWEGIRDILTELRSLRTLFIDDGRDYPLAWALFSLPCNQLRILHCAFILDTCLLRTLQGQKLLEEFAWKGGLIRLPTIHIADGGEQGNATRTPDNHDNPSQDASFPDSDEPLISVIESYLDLSTLPHLKYLTSESVALARALVPGRAITHLWVPGAAFSPYLSSGFLNDQIRSPSKSSSEHIRNARPRLDASSVERSEQIRRAVEDFSLSTGPVLSLRIQLDLHRPELMDVLSCIARKLPKLRTLGFMPSYILEYPRIAPTDATNNVCFTSWIICISFLTFCRTFRIFFSCQVSNICKRFVYYRRRLATHSRVCKPHRAIQNCVQWHAFTTRLHLSGCAFPSTRTSEPVIKVVFVGTSRHE